jgi:EPS-associated MarR family transcriptional regulator
MTPTSRKDKMAMEIGLSLGKFNYCLKELVKKGIVKIERFTTSDRKAGYMYILTPNGIEQKTKITVNFLKRKMDEYERIKKEIEELKGEVEGGNN